MSKSEVTLDDDLPFEEKDRFWSLIYDKVSKAVRKRHSFTIVFHMDEEGLENDEGYSVIIKKDDYEIFLRNFLMWSEDLERYEICYDAKKLIEELEIWKLFWVWERMQRTHIVVCFPINNFNFGSKIWLRFVSIQPDVLKFNFHSLLYFLKSYRIR